MGSVVIPFLMSMLLGRTIDLSTYTVGGDVFDHAEYTESPIYITNSTYTILQEDVFPYSYVGLPADLVLRIKTGSLSSSSGTLGLDGFIREASWRTKSVVLAVTTLVQTVYRELKDDAVPLHNWTTRIDAAQTHYAQSTVYGGWSAFLYRFKCDVPGDEETVRRILTSKMGVTGVMDDSAAEKWKNALAELAQSDELGGNFTTYVHAYSNLDLREDVSTPDNAMKAIDKFTSDVGTVGQPLFVELEPLHKMDNKYPDVKADHELDRHFESLDEMFDDLRTAKISLRKWLLETLAEFTEEEEERISDLLDHISRSVHLFHKIASEASIYKPMDVNFMKAAALMYNRKLTKGSRSYMQLYRQLKEDLDADCEDGFGPRIKGLLEVPNDEMLEMGEMSGGIEECKALCIQEPKCRAIGYIETIPVLVVHDGKPIVATVQQGFRIIRKSKQCWLYFRCSNTARITSVGNQATKQVYDRKCH